MRWAAGVFEMGGWVVVSVLALWSLMGKPGDVRVRVPIWACTGYASVCLVLVRKVCLVVGRSVCTLIACNSCMGFHLMEMDLVRRVIYECGDHLEYISLQMVSVFLWVHQLLSDLV